ncbi:MAG TPA: TolC family protein [Armatimonadota bacterium]
MNKPTPWNPAPRPRRKRAAWAILALALPAAAAPVTASPSSAEITVTAPGVDAPETLTLDSAVLFALEHNELVRESEAGARKARAGVREVSANNLPQVSVSAQAVRQKESTATLPGATGPISLTLAAPHAEVASANLTQALDIFGQVRRARNIASLAARIEALNVARSRSEVTFETRAAYYDVLRAAGAVEVAQAAVEDATEQLRLAHSFVNAGSAAPFDVTRADVALADRRQTLLGARNSLALAGAAFNNVLGRPVSTPVRVTALSTAPNRDVDIDGQTEKALVARPEVLQADLAVEAQRETVRLHRLDTAPMIALTGSATHLFNPTGLSSQADTWTAGVGASWPLWDSGAARARVDAAKANVEVAGLQREQLRRGVALEVRQAGLNVQDTSDRFDVADKTVGQAEEALRLARTRYQNGVSAQIEVLDAETALVQARFNRNNALYDHLAARAAFDRALMGRLSAGG